MCSWMKWGLKKKENPDSLEAEKPPKHERNVKENTGLLYIYVIIRISAELSEGSASKTLYFSFSPS